MAFIKLQAIDINDYVCNKEELKENYYQSQSCINVRVDEEDTHLKIISEKYSID